MGLQKSRWQRFIDWLRDTRGQVGRAMCRLGRHSWRCCGSSRRQRSGHLYVLFVCRWCPARKFGRRITNEHEALRWRKHHPQLAAEGEELSRRCASAKAEMRENRRREAERSHRGGGRG
jgi:hypothetical protein